MPSDLPDKIFTSDEEKDAWMADIRERAKAARIAEGMTWEDMARQVGMAPGTLGPVVTGTYRGNTVGFLAMVERWLIALAARKAALAVVSAGPGFVHTKTAQAFHAVMEHAQFTPDIAVLTGSPGVGKTSAAEHYERSRPNVYRLFGQPCATGPNAMIQDMAAALNLSGYGAPTRASREIMARLNGTRALVICDEAQHYGTKALDQLRTWHDQCGVGIVIMGNEEVASGIDGASRTVAFAQLFSRVGMRLRRPTALKADAEAILDAWRVEEKRVRAGLLTIARKPGALRVMHKVLCNASRMAATDGRELSFEDVDLAWQQTSPGETGALT